MIVKICGASEPPQVWSEGAKRSQPEVTVEAWPKDEVLKVELLKVLARTDGYLLCIIISQCIAVSPASY